MAQADAALAASIFHFGEFTIPETKRLLAEKGVHMRPPFKPGKKVEANEKDGE